MTTNNLISNAAKKAAAARLLGKKHSAMAVNSPRFHKHCPWGANLTVNISNGEQPKASSWKIFLRWIGMLALIAFISFAVSVWTFIELDYLSDKTVNDNADFATKLEYFMAKRGLYINWRGFSLPQVYVVEKVPMDPSIGEHYEVIDGEGWIIRPLGGMDSIAIQAASDDQGVYWESEVIIWPASERGRG